MKSKTLNFFRSLVPAFLPLTAYICSAQEPKKILRIGYLTTASAPTEMPRLNAFKQKLHSLGYIERQNLVIEFRPTDGKFEPFLLLRLRRQAHN